VPATARRLAVLAAAAAVALPANAALADPSTKCFNVPAVYTYGPKPTTQAMHPCIPWPLPI
jgi:hypothetical protein